MPKIKKLHVENFRTHEKADIVFGSGITAIVGLSGSGKTNLIRAIRWVLTNRPSGNSPRKRNTLKDKVTSVSITTDDDNTVTLLRGTNYAEYRVNDESYKSFGMKVPDQVSQTLNLSDINLQGQLDPHFLATSSSSEFSKAINAVTGIDVAQAWIKEINHRISDQKAQRALKMKQISDLERDIESMKGLDDMPKMLRVVQNLRNNADATKAEIAELRKTGDRVVFLQKAIDDLAPAIERLERLYLQMQLSRDRAKELEERMYSLWRKKETLEALGRAQSLKPIFEKMDLELLSLGNMKVVRDKLKSDLEGYHKALTTCHSVSELVESNHKMVYEFLHNIAKHSICPTCAAPITDDIAERIIETYYVETPNEDFIPLRYAPNVEKHPIPKG